MHHNATCMLIILFLEAAMANWLDWCKLDPRVWGWFPLIAMCKSIRQTIILLYIHQVWALGGTKNVDMWQPWETHNGMTFQQMRRRRASSNMRRGSKTEIPEIIRYYMSTFTFTLSPQVVHLMRVLIFKLLTYINTMPNKCLSHSERVYHYILCTDISYWNSQCLFFLLTKFTIKNTTLCI